MNRDRHQLQKKKSNLRRWNQFFLHLRREFQHLATRRWVPQAEKVVRVGKEAKEAGMERGRQEGAAGLGKVAREGTEAEVGGEGVVDAGALLQDQPFESVLLRRKPWQLLPPRRRRQRPLMLQHL
jgi:hypothetical protein